MARSDVIYVVFCRLHGIETMPTDELAASVKRLAELASRHADSGIENYSSVYGRFLLVPALVVDALRLGVTLLDDAASSGISLAIAITCGRLEPTPDLVRENVVGTAINMGARHTFLPNSEGRIVVDLTVAEDATRATSSFAFTRRQKGKVKRTLFEYRRLHHQPPKVIPLPNLSPHPVTPEQVHVVAYDIERFSEAPTRDFAPLVTELTRAVKNALAAAGGENLLGDSRLYSPAGDGGVLVFSSHEGGGGLAAWTFARSLQLEARTRIPLRIGVATGSVCIIESNLPVGEGILAADKLSGKARKGQICVSKRFWSDVLPDAQKHGWTASPLPKRSAAFLLTPPGELPPLSERSDIPLAFRRPENAPPFLSREGIYVEDFMEGSVVTPPIWNDLINQLKHEHVMALEGPPGSGKTTLALYCLTKIEAPKNVHYLAGTILQDDTATVLSRTVRDYPDNTVAIVDDAHLVPRQISLF